MKIEARFEDGALHIYLIAETAAEQAMIGAVIGQPQEDTRMDCLDKSLISASIDYEGHWTNKRVSQVKLSVYRQEADSSHD